MTTIAVLGMGLLGSGFVENLLSLGHTVQVWNRTASKCAPLVEKGALAAATPADAVRGVDRVHLVLRADDAVDSVIEQLRPGLSDGTPILDHSTNLPARVATRFEVLRSAGVRYLHAPVFMAPRNAQAATGLMLIAGPKEDVDALRPALETMTGTVTHMGERPDKAAAVKIIGNGMLVMLSAAMRDLFAIGKNADVSPEEIIGLFETFSPSPAGMGQRALRMKGQPASFELTMARKDVQLMIDTAGADSLHLLPVIAQVMEQGIADGHGAADYTAVFHPDAVRS
ncbi:MAG: NAD(P)-binding domain-containing protein [Myxococcota bacterium]